MKNYRLDYLLRKNRGREKLSDYKETFFRAGFQKSELEYVDLIEADQIRNKVREIFIDILQDGRMYLGQTSTLEISQLSSLYHSSIISQNCYIFSDEVDICGMFLVDTKIGLLNCLKVARLSFGNTCFIVGSKFDFSLTINYYDKEHNDFKDIYDIQRKTILLLSI